MALPYSDTFTDADGSAPSADWTLTQSTGSTTTILSNRLHMAPSSAGGYTDYNRATLADLIPADFEVTFQVITTSNPEQYTGITFRGDGSWVANGNMNNGFRILIIQGTQAWHLERFNANVATNMTGDLAYTTIGSTINVKVRCSGSSVKVRLWNDPASEPGTWTYETTDSWFTSQTRFGFTTEGGSAVTTRVVDFDTLSFTTPSILPVVPTLVQTIGSTTAQAAGTTLDVTFAGATKPQIGDWIVVRCSRDIVAADAPPTGDSISVTPGGETYTRTAKEAPANAASGAGTGIVGVLFRAKVVTAWAAGTNTVRWTHPSVTAKAMHVEHWTNIDVERSGSAQSAISAAGAPSVTSGTITSGDVVMGMAAIEGSSTQAVTADSDTSNGSWSAQFTQVASGASGNATTARTFAKVVGQYKVVTGTATQTYNVTNANTTSVNAVAIVVGFAPPTVVNPTTISTAVTMPAPSISSVAGGTSVSLATIATTTSIPVALPLLDQYGNPLLDENGNPLLTPGTEVTVSVPAGTNVTMTTIATSATMPSPTKAVTALPATIATAATMPAPTKAVTALPATIATAATMPSPTETASGAVSPATIATVATMPSPALTATGNVTTTTIATVVTMPAPAVVTGTVVAPATIATAATMPAPTETVGATPATIATAATVGQPTKTATGNVTASTIATAATTPSPALTATGNVTTTVIATAVTMPSPTETAAGNVTTATIATAVTMAAPTKTVGATPSTIATAVTMAAPTTTATGNVAPTTIATATTMPAPSVLTGTVVGPSTIATAVTMASPTETASGNVTTTTVATVATMPSPAETASGSVSPTTIATAATIGQPTKTATGNVTTTTIATVVTMPSPSVTGGSSGGVTPATIATAATMPAPAISSSGNVTTTTVATVVTMAAPTKTASGNATAATIVTVTTLPAPSVRADAQKTTTTIVTTTTLPAPNVAAVSSTVVTPATIATAATIPPLRISAGLTTTTIATAVAMAAPVIHIVGLIYSLLGDVIGDVVVLDIEGDVDDLAAILAQADELVIEGSVQS